MATISLFGLNADSVRAHHFPNMDAWTSSSRPSSTTVTEVLNEEAGRLAGYLNAQNIDASSITDATSPAYLSCRKQLRMMVALVIARDMTGTAPQLAEKWEENTTAWLDALREKGATALGGGAVASGTSDPDGPTSHFSVYSLAGDDAADMSSTIPALRKDDEL